MSGYGRAVELGADNAWSGGGAGGSHGKAC